MTPGDAADVSPFIRLASGTSVSIYGGWVAFGCAMPIARIVDASSSTDRLSSIRSAVDAAACVASGSSHAIVNIGDTATADRSRVTEDAFPVAAAGGV
jgi:hypothetical protein